MIHCLLLALALGVCSAIHFTAINTPNTENSQPHRGLSTFSSTEASDLLTKADCEKIKDVALLICSLVVAAEKAEHVKNIPMLEFFVAYPQAFRDYVAGAGLDGEDAYDFDYTDTVGQLNAVFEQAKAILDEKGSRAPPAGVALLLRLRSDVSSAASIRELVALVPRVSKDVWRADSVVTQEFFDIVTDKDKIAGAWQEVWPICRVADKKLLEHIASKFPKLRPLQGCFVSYFLFNEPDNSALTHLLISQLTTAESSQHFKYSKASFLVNMLVSTLKNRDSKQAATYIITKMHDFLNDVRLARFRDELRNIRYSEQIAALSSGDEDCMMRNIRAQLRSFPYVNSVTKPLVLMHKEGSGLFACSAESLTRLLGTADNVQKLTSPAVMTARPNDQIIPSNMARLIDIEDDKWLHDTALHKLQTKVAICLEDWQTRGGKSPNC